MQITDQNGVILVEHNGKAIQMTRDDLEAIREMSPGDLVTYARANLYPNAGRRKRKALNEILNAAAKLPAAFADFDASQQDDEEHDNPLVPC